MRPLFLWKNPGKSKKQELLPSLSCLNISSIQYYMYSQVDNALKCL